MFLCLAPLFFIYSGYNELFGFLPVTFVLWQYLVVQGFALLLYIFIRRFVQAPKPAAICTLLLVAPLLMFGFLHDLLKSSGVPRFFGSYTFILPILGILFIASIYWFRHYNSVGWRDHYFYFNLLLLALMISEIPNSIRRYQLDQSVHNLIDFRFTTQQEYQQKKRDPAGNRPDIFFLVFDAMASSESLLETMGRDNRQLDTFLHRQGFRVIPHSAANYNWTIHSISTTLNMQYLPDYIVPVMNDLKVYFWGSASFLDNSLIKILQQEGYRTHQFQPISFNNPDWPHPTFFGDLKSQHFYFKTLPGRVYRDIFWNYTRVNNRWVKQLQAHLINRRYNARKTELERTLQKIKQSCIDTTQPKFVYGHFMLPHDPYSFDAEGNIKTVTPQSLPKESKTEEPELYFEQVTYANRIIEELVKYIQAKNKTETVIIVAGDHGYKYYEKEQSHYNFRNLSAIYFPDGDYATLYDSLTPVNTFRLVLNKYLGANLPLLTDSSIYVSEKREAIHPSKKIRPAGTPSAPAR
ncbi:MAG TPA: sulfatase-like hydrolase/transferase [Lacibacter sp.]|nr:sulfatase-like hydrolase/transferase [Lacibacter sp.]HMO89435.1 sulfatase-like hydrolase/transferase [Lacibacter sp.]